VIYYNRKYKLIATGTTGSKAEKAFKEKMLWSYGDAPVRE
jgi:methylglyoxal synthase